MGLRGVPAKSPAPSPGVPDVRQDGHHAARAKEARCCAHCCDGLVCLSDDSFVRARQEAQVESHKPGGQGYRQGHKHAGKALGLPVMAHVDARPLTACAEMEGHDFAEPS